MSMKEVREFSKCYNFLIKDVIRFTLITKTLQTWLHRLPRTLELYDVTTSLSRLEATPWVELALENHC